MNQYDVVLIVKDIPSERVSKWSIGTILEVYDETHYEIEISDKEGITTFLGALSNEYFELIWENSTMTYVGRFKMLLDIFNETKCIIDRPDTDMAWTSYCNEKEFISEFNLLIDDFKRGVKGCIDRFKLLFAPTGILQEISISNGWGERFIEISDRFDKLICLP